MQKTTLYSATIIFRTRSFNQNNRFVIRIASWLAGLWSFVRLNMWYERLWQLLAVCIGLLGCGKSCNMAIYEHRMWATLTLIQLINDISLSVSSFDIKVTSNSPVLLGDTLVLNATVYDNRGYPMESKFCFTWSFHGLKQTSEDSPPYSSWVIPMQSNFHSGKFIGTVDVSERIMGFCIISSTQKFKIQYTGTFV